MQFKLLLILVWVTSPVFGQDTLTLQECFRRAERSRYTAIVERSALSVAETRTNFHALSFLPDLSASSGVGVGFGRVLDPVSNQFSNNQVNSNFLSLNSSVTLFNGLNYFNRKSKLGLTQHQMEVQLDQSLNQLYTDIASLYIDLCIKQSQVKQQHERVVYLENILAIQRALFRAGKISHIDTLRAQNLVLKEQSEKIRLNESLQKMELRLNIRIGAALNERHTFDISQTNQRIQPNESYQLEMNAIELELLSVEEKRTRASILPTVTANATLGTNYSTALKENPSDFQSPPMPYRNQLDLNLYQNVSIQVNIPLFNKGEYLKNKRIQTIKEAELSAQTALLETQLELRKQEVDLQYNSIEAQLKGLEMSVENLKEIYEAMLELYKAGKVVFNDVENAFQEWQTEVLNYEYANFERIRIGIMRWE